VESEDCAELLKSRISAERIQAASGLRWLMVDTTKGIASAGSGLRNALIM